MTTLHLIYGPQGAGKSTHAIALARSHGGALHLAIDDWMGQLFGPDLPQPLDMPWIMTRVARCETRIWQIAEDVLGHGGNVILDLGFMKRAQRQAATARAAATGAKVQWHFLDAPHAVRRARVAARNLQRGASFAFEVTPGMFDFMEAQFEAPDIAERSKALVKETLF